MTEVSRDGTNFSLFISGTSLTDRTLPIRVEASSALQLRFSIIYFYSYNFPPSQDYLLNKL